MHIVFLKFLDKLPKIQKRKLQHRRDLIKVIRPDGATIDLGHDSEGRLNTTTYPEGTTRLAYNLSTGNLKSITTPDGGTITYAYDGSLLIDTVWSGSIS